MKKKLIGYLLISIVTFYGFGQSREFLNVVNMRQQSGGAIYKNDVVSGYYFFYSIGSATKGKKTFILSILDENLNDVNTKTFEEGKKTFLIDGNFNGENIVLKFYDRKARKMSYLYFDTRGELLKRDDLDFVPGGMTVVNNDGFVDYLKEYYDQSYSIRFLPTVDSTANNAINPWYKTFDPPAKNVAFADYLCTANNLIVNMVSIKRTRTGTKINFRLQGIDYQTGEEAFNIDLQDSYNNQPLKAYFNEEKQTINLIGLFYSPDVKALKDNGSGLFNYEINLSGEILDKQYLFWTREFREYMEIDNSGMAVSEERKGFLYFHEILRHEDGSIIAIAEQYRKAADAAGIALNVAGALLGGGASASTTKIQVYDMAIFHFNSDFSIRDVRFIPKTKSNITLPSGYDFTNVHLLANYVRAIGGFDYLYTTQNDQEGTTSITYLDYEKVEGEPRQWAFNAATLYDGEYTMDKLKIGRPSDAKNLAILPGKPGNVVVVEYNKEEKSLSIYLEKINY